MEDTRLQFRRVIDLPSVIVWDALVDPVLLEGWLAVASVDAVPGGEYRLDWIRPVGLQPFIGAIDILIEHQRLTVSTITGQSLDFVLESVDGGTRGSHTIVTIDVCTLAERAFHPSVIAHWRSNLEQLEELLRGHPVDWANWERDRGSSWARRIEHAQRKP